MSLDAARAFDSYNRRMDRLRDAERQELDRQRAVNRAAPTDTQRLDWLDQHCSFVADQEFNIGPYKIGDLRKMADDGIKQSAALDAPGRVEGQPK